MWEDQRENECYFRHIAPETYLECHIAIQHLRCKQWNKVIYSSLFSQNKPHSLKHLHRILSRIVLPKMKEVDGWVILWNGYALPKCSCVSSLRQLKNGLALAICKIKRLSTCLVRYFTYSTRGHALTNTYCLSRVRSGSMIFSNRDSSLGFSHLGWG